MLVYRFALLDLDERITRQELLRCEDDAAALACAQQRLLQAPVVEIWRGGRFVNRVRRALEPPSQID